MHPANALSALTDHSLPTASTWAAPIPPRWEARQQGELTAHLAQLVDRGISRGGPQVHIAARAAKGEALP